LTTTTAAVAIAALVLVSAGTAQAAFITRQDQKGTTSIVIEGKIEKQDDEHFRQTLATIPSDRSITIKLSSPGGSIGAALAIGDIIHQREFSTSVSEYTECFSACAFIWLAGRARWSTATSLIGFHGPGEIWLEKTICPSDDFVRSLTAWSAYTGAYVFEWGIPHEAIFFVAATPSNEFEMNLLTEENSREMHIAHRGALPIEKDLKTLLRTFDAKSDRDPLK
jgi:hypothetical protein